MKHFILLLIAMLMSVSVPAQKIYVKKTQAKAYYHIVYENGNERYVLLPRWTQPTRNNLEDVNVVISEKKYDSVSVKEELYANEMYTSYKIRTMEGKEAMNDEKTIKAVPIQGMNIASFTPFQQGENYELFRVISAKDTALVGQSVVCQILERRKSNISGSEGRLSILPLYIDTPGGKVPLMPTPIHRRGLNKTNAKFWTSIFIIPIFIPGTRAEVAQGETLTLRLE